jgi:hypothetical protein
MELFPIILAEMIAFGVVLPDAERDAGSHVHIQYISYFY